jgi:formate-dependent nitrite reductase complex subunit NrfF
MERTVVRCAEGHVFSAASFPMQQAERLGPGRLMRCPRCARLRSVVPVPVQAPVPVTTGVLQEQ